jgi:hypothetical protein
MSRSTESVLLAIAPITTRRDGMVLTNASGFFFCRDDRLYLVTSRHVFYDAPTGHYPDEIYLDLHTDKDNLAAACSFSIPLYEGGIACWRQGQDDSGEIDVAVIEVDKDALPDTAVYRAFTPAHLQPAGEPLELGTPLLIIGFPLGLRDTLHHMAVARHAIIASSFGLRFTGKGFFLTDGRTHRGSSGAPVIMRKHEGGDALVELPYRLLGIHSARLELAGRDVERDEALGLNCAWYADVLGVLTER